MVSPDPTKAGPVNPGLTQAKENRGGMFPPGKALPSDEPVVMLLKPSLVWVFLRTPGRLMGLSVLLVLLLVWGWVFGRGLWGFGVELVGAVVLLFTVQVAWNVLQYEARWYALTGSRVVAIGGVLGRFSSEVPLDAVRGITVVRPWLERALGVGGVGFGSAATGGMEVVWVGLRDADGVADRVRSAISGGGDGRGESLSVSKTKPGDPGKGSASESACREKGTDA